MAGEELERPNLDVLMDEGVRDYNIEQLAEKSEDPTPGELREILGDESKDLSDEQVTELYKRSGSKDEGKEKTGTEKEQPTGQQRGPDGKFLARAKTGEGAEGETPAPPTWTRPYNVVGVDEKDLDAETLAAFAPYADKVRFKVPVDGVQRVVDFDGLVRHYQRNVMNERRLNSLLDEKNASAPKLSELEARAAQADEDRKFYEKILGDQTGATFKAAQEAYLRAVLSGEQPPVQQTAPAEQSVSPEEQQAAEYLYQSICRPTMEKLAIGYTRTDKAPTAEESIKVYKALDVAFKNLAAREGYGLTDARLAEILNIELPHILAETGFRRVAAPAQQQTAGPVDPEKESLRKELESLKAERQKEKLKNAPGSGGGGSPRGDTSANDLKDVKTFKDMKKLLDDPEWTAGM